MAYFVGDFSDLLGYEPVTHIVDGIDYDFLRAEMDSCSPNIIYTWNEVNLLEGFRPTVVKRLMKTTGKSAEFVSYEGQGSRESTWGNRYHAQPDETLGQRIAFSLQSDCVSKFAAVSPSVVGAKRDEESVNSKTCHVNRLGYLVRTVMGIPVDIREVGDFRREYTDADPSDVLDEALSNVLLASTEITKAMPTYLKVDFPKRKRRDVVRGEELFGYAPKILNRMGDEALAILAYGSAAEAFLAGNGVDGVNDVDYMVVVPSGMSQDGRRTYLRKWLDAYRGECPHHNEKEVEINFVEEGAFEKFILYEHNPIEFAERTVLLHGEPEVPVVSEAYNRMRIISQTVARCRQVKWLSMWAMAEPDKLIYTLDLHRFAIKTPRFMLRGIEGLDGKRMTKQELDAKLAEEYHYSPHPPMEGIDREEVKENVLDTFMVSTQLMDKLAGTVPDLSFMKDDIACSVTGASLSKAAAQY